MVDTHVTTLADGRDLAWIEVGDPRGRPVFAFHGTPGTRLSFGSDDKAVATLGVRLVAVDRPGYGLSTFQPGRRLVGWADDVAALADHLEIERFGVAGVSGGGPHAIVCAARLGTRVTAAAIISAVGPLADPAAAEGMMPINRALSSLARKAPIVLRPVFGAMVGVMRRFPDRAMASMLKGVPAADVAVLSRPEVRAVFEAEFHHVSRTAGRAAAQDFTLFARDWGFSLSDIIVPVRLWQGDADVNVPVGHAQLQHDAIPGSTLVACPGEGHMLVFDHLEEILGYIAAA